MERDIRLSVRRQCELLGVNRSVVYFVPKGESAENLEIMRKMDEIHLKGPTAGSRRMRAYLDRKESIVVARSRVRRLMKLMGIEAIYPRARTTIPGPGSQIYPYLLNDLEIIRPNQVWCTDISYIPMARGFMYLVCIMDWYSRKILSWELSNTLDVSFCLKALESAIEVAITTPEIFNTDQGCQFTSHDWTDRLKELEIAISMDGKGRWIDNVMIERFWRSIKYEDIYLKSYENAWELEKGISEYMIRYNSDRPHQSLGEVTPDEVYECVVKLAA